MNVLADFVGNDAIGLHLHDDVATPGETTLAALPYFSTQPFQSGVDILLPAADPSDSTITVRNIPRGDTDRPQTLNVPNWPSSPPVSAWCSPTIPSTDGGSTQVAGGRRAPDSRYLPAMADKRAVLGASVDRLAAWSSP